MDYSSFLNKFSQNRKPSALREFFDGLGVDHSYVLMAGGMPNPEVFPVKSMSFTTGDGQVVQVSKEDLEEGLQYGVTVGNPRIRKFLKELTKRLHDPPLMDDPNHPGAPEIMTSCGAQDGIYKTFETILNEGDTIIAEEQVYPSVLSVVQPLGCKVLTARADKDGIIPESLESALSTWPKPTDGGPSRGTLKALYCVPNGDNPTGIRYSADRKREIYRLAHEYNFLIIEDDAYYFLEQRPFVESFLSMDVDGRVIRIETFSKTVSPGLRLGYVTLPKPLFTQMRYIAQASTQGTSSLSQIFLLQLLTTWGGVDGYLKHCEEVSDFYAKRRIICEQMAQKHLKGIAEWYAPTGGMFFWIKFPGIEDTLSLVMDRLLKRKVLMVAGAAFSPDPCSSSKYVRVSFSIASAADMEKGFSILAEELLALQTGGKV